MVEAGYFCQIGDAGIQLVVQFVDPAGAPIDLSGASGLLIRVRYPDNTTAADFAARLLSDGRDGKIYYLTTGVDISQAGLYQIQGNATVSGEAFSTRLGQFFAFENVRDN